MMEKRKELRPWNVKAGDQVEGPAFWWGREGGPVARYTVRMVTSERSWMTSERYWTLYVDQDDDRYDGRWGSYYRDQRVTVYRTEGER